MFGELPKLFDRNFAMAFFLPVTVFIWIIGEIADRFGKSANLIASLQTNLIIGTTLLVIVSWLGGIFLLVTNRGLYRFLEGYGKWNPVQVLSRLEKWRYKKLINDIETLDDEFRKMQNNFPAEKRAQRNKLMIERSVRFPDKESLLLPTSFGNTLRAFEVYPRLMYGIESIDGWSRLLAIIPKDYRELMDNAKTQVDFWVNFGFLGFLLSLEYAGFAIYTRSLPAWWMFLLILLVTAISPHFAREFAVEWGDYVKAAFDVFAPQLRETLGLNSPKNRDEEKQQWTKFSQAIIYGLPEVIPELKKDDKKVRRSRRSPAKKRRM